MQKENRNNRVHTGEQSGKTDFLIERLLPVGKENAITTQDLVKLSGCGSARELQQRIAYEREQGAIICSGSGRGYWRPKDRQEIQEFVHTMNARALNTLKAVKSAKRALKVPEGQQSMNGGNEDGKDIYNTCAPQDGERVQFDQNDDVQYTDPEKKQSQIDERKENFEKIYAIYPKKRGKQRAFGLYCQWLKGRVIQGERIKLTNKEMYVAVRNYVRQQEQEQPDQKYWKNFDTLMGATLLDYVDKGEINE